MRPLFDSRDSQYRSPVGAQPAGQTVLFRICLPRSLSCQGARLCCQSVAADGIARSTRDNMFWAGMEGDNREWWDCRLTPAAPAVLWYWFELDTALGTQALSRLDDGTAELRQPGSVARWQLTVYDPAFVTPDWLAGGILYQIFPDRFARSSSAKADVPADRLLREDWGGQPEWKPNAQGKIVNKDYFGGDLQGIEQRLDYLASLGVTGLYLNPVFEAHSNHRYDTADYTRIDPLLGTEAEFLSLVRSARQVGIRVILDGVFSHTGADSVYFNREGRYPALGAAQSPDSPYASWYRFTHWPDRYQAWWGFETLPEVQETDPAFMEFINGADGVVRHRIRQGVGGWRLDVADELPDAFLDALYAAAKAENPDSLVLGEVWEDASHKESYGHLRRYLLGGQMDSVMNYPFREAILAYLHGGAATAFIHRIADVVENYPPQVTRLLMNHIGTHDTERALTLLAGEPADGHGREWQARQSLTAQQRETGIQRLKLATALQYTLPGVPCIYYGDEVGMEGYRDPFNRGCFPWGQENRELTHWYRRLGQLRRNAPALREGAFTPLFSGDGVVCYERRGAGQRLLCAVNAADGERTVTLPAPWGGCTLSLGDGQVRGEALWLPARSCALATLPEDDWE